MRRLLSFVALALVACNSTTASKTTPLAPSPSASASPSAIASAGPSASASPSASAAIPTFADGGDPLEIEARKQWERDAHVDIVYVPTPQKVVDKMLDVAKVTSSDVVYDLGCGDGRIVVTSAKRGAKAVGFDIDPKRVEDARAHVKSAGVESNASIRWANVFSVDLQPATVVTLYLLPDLNVRLIPQLDKLRPGTRIVSHDFDMKGVKPDAEVTITAEEFVNSEGYSAYKGESVPEDAKHYGQRTHRIYLWTVPLKKIATATR